VKIKHKFLIAVSVAALAGTLLLTSCSPLGCATPISRGWAGGTLADGTLFVASMNGKLIAINPANNTQIGSPAQLTTTSTSGLFSCATSANVVFYSTPVVSGVKTEPDPNNANNTLNYQIVYIGGANGMVYAYKFENNTFSSDYLFVYPRQATTGSIVGNIILDNDTIYYANSNGYVFALNAEDLTLKWSQKIDSKIWSGPTIDGSTLYIGCFNKTLYALNTADGSIKWQFLADGAINSTPVVDNGTVYIGDYNRAFYAVDAATGNLKWKFPPDANSAVTPKDFFWAEPVIVNGVIYAPNLDGHIYALDTVTGKLVKDIPLSYSISSSPVVVGNDIVVATSVASYAESKQKVNIYIIDTTNNNSVSVPLALPLHEGVNAPLFAVGNTVYLHTYKDNLYTINVAAPQTQPALLFNLSTLK
jgi:eukaryotic-like serine/threonine-protein kinase